MGRLDDLLQARLARRADSSKLRRLTISPPGGVDFSSNDYLSLGSNVELQRAVLSQLEARVSSAERNECPRAILGSGGSRLLDGNSAFAEGLERRLAEFHRAPAALLFNSAYDANVGLLSCVPQPGDIILYDEAIHASVHDGMRMSRASRRLPFSHSSVAGISENGEADQGVRPSLNEILRQITSGDQGKPVREGVANVFVCVEGMYSMDGSVARLREAVESVETHLPLRNGYVIVDEAHSVGILGDQGRGLVCELGLENRVWARVHGFGKALGCAGGVVLCSHTARSYLINYARTLIYTTAMSFSSLINIDTVYNYLGGGRAEAATRHLRHLIDHCYSLLGALCSHLRHVTHLLRIGAKTSASPIIAVFTEQPRSLAAYCGRRGIIVRPIVAPTVPAGTERIRICLHAGNSTDQIEGLVKVMEQWVHEQVKLEFALEGNPVLLGSAGLVHGKPRL